MICNLHQSHRHSPWPLELLDQELWASPRTKEYTAVAFCGARKVKAVVGTQQVAGTLVVGLDSEHSLVGLENALVGSEDKEMEVVN